MSHVKDSFMLRADSEGSLCSSVHSFQSASSSFHSSEQDLDTDIALRSVPILGLSDVAAAFEDVASPSSTASQPSENDVDYENLSEFSLFRAAFQGNTVAMEALLKGIQDDDCGPEALSQTDKHGLTPLHISAMRNHPECIHLLINGGAQLHQKTTNGWTPIEEALSYRCPLAVAALLQQHQVEIQQKIQQKSAELHAVLSDMPDCAFQLKWELTSSVIGVLIHKYLPHDTYTVYKKGTSIRIDGSLKGLKDDGSMLPNWKYGSFSILVDAGIKKPSAMFVDHDKETYMPLEAPDDEDSESTKPPTKAQADQMLQSKNDVRRSRIKFCNFKLEPVKGWLTPTVKEELDGVSTTVYEAQGELVANTVIKQRLPLPAKDATYEDYIAARPVGNIVAEVPLNFANGFDANAAEADATEQAQEAWMASNPRPDTDPLAPGEVMNESDLFPGLSPDSITVAAPGTRGKIKGKGHGRKVKARLWMGHKFPLNQKQLLPLLDIMGTTNKHLKKVATFMRKFGDLDLFPVKVQLPLMFSMRIAVRVKNLCLWGPEAQKQPKKRISKTADAKLRICPSDDFFSIPAGYKLKDVANWVESSIQKKSAKDNTNLSNSRRSTPRGANFDSSDLSDSGAIFSMPCA